PIVHECFFERLHGGMVVRLEYQLRSGRIPGGDHRQPAMLAQRYLGHLHESEDVGVEVKGLVLVVDEDTGQVDLDHRALLGGRRPGDSGHRSAMWVNGSKWT